MPGTKRSDAIPAGRLAVGGPAGEEALQALTEMIRSRELGPGDRLPTERQLAENIGLSRNTVREALRALEMMGVLDVRRGDGIYVTSLEPKVLLQATTFVVQLLQDHSLVETFEVRAILESSAAQLAAIRISPERLHELEMVLEQFGNERWSSQWLEADLRFHALIATAAGNEVLGSLLASLSVNTSETRNLQGETHPDNSVHNARLQHQRIYEAIARRDPIGAGFEAGAHVAATAGWLRRLSGEADGLASRGPGRERGAASGRRRGVRGIVAADGTSGT